jgi:hypothetical protein
MSILRATLLGGLVAGALDIVFAFVFYGPMTLNASPERILQSVAAGLLGREAAFAGGLQAAALGTALHFFIATMMALAFVAIARFVPLLTRFAWISGPLYGLLLYVIMTYLVVPMSAAGGRPPPEGIMLYGALFTHAFFVGLPIALIAQRFGRRA